MTDASPTRSSPDTAEAVARAIAENGFGRPWDDFLPLNAHDTDQSDLIEYAQAALDAGSSDGCFDMLWQWFTERRGADDMRANAADGGLSADDFKQMLDEHELNIMAPQPVTVAQGKPDRLAVAMEIWHRFAPESVIEWEDEAHQAEYLFCADAILALPSTGGGTAA